MKKLYLFFLLLIFLSPLFVNAQANFKPGYIVNTPGDTTKGFIDYKDWNLNPTEVTFKKELSNQQTQIYIASDIDGFAVNGYEYYKRYSGTITMDKVSELNILSSTLDTSTTTGTFFLKVLATGKNITLYSYTDHIKERFFIAETGKLPIELIYHMFLRPTEKETTYVVKIDLYRQQLEALAIKYQPQNTALLHDIKSVDYTQNIEKIVSKINNSPKTVLFTTANHNSGIQFFLGGGINAVNSSPGYLETTSP